MSCVDLESNQHRHGEYATRSLNLKVPSLQVADHWISESGAIIEFLEEFFPAPNYPTTSPVDPIQRALDRSLMQYLRTDFFQLRQSLPFENLMLRKPFPKMVSAETESEANRLLAIALKRIEQSKSGSLADFELSFYLQRIIHAANVIPGIDVRVAEYANFHWNDEIVKSWRDLDRTNYLGESL